MPSSPVITTRAALLAALLALPALAQSAPLPEPLPAGSANLPVERLDLQRYLGTWHEIARLPMFFQRRCASDTSATYAMSGERLTVTNRCRTAEGGMIESVGLARTTPTPGALEVSFLPAWLGWLPGVWADYWVVDLDPDYRWAVVGGPGQGALWVLSREPSMEPALLERIRQRAEARGYDLDEWIVAPAAASPP